MRTIYKYEVSIADEFTLLLPTGAEILTIQMQHSQIILWAIVDAIRKAENRTIIMRGTRHLLPDRAIKYISTVKQEMFIWHFFEVLSPI